MKKVLVCGATGFIGRNIAERLCQSDEYDVTGTYFRRPPYDNPRIRFEHADLTDKDQVEALVQGKDIVLQYAANVSNVSTNPHMTENVIMSLLLMRAAHDHGVEHFVFPSCGYLYNHGETPFRESDIDYGALPQHYFAATWSKIYCERMCEFYAGLGGTKFSIIRQANVYGGHDKLELESAHAVPSIIMKVVRAQGSGLEVWGDGTQRKDMIFVSDLVDAIELILEQKANPFDLLNIGSGTFVSIREIAEYATAVSGKKLDIMFDASKPSSSIVWRLDSTLAKQMLGWKPRVGVQEGIRRTYEWYAETLAKVG